MPHFHDWKCFQTHSQLGEHHEKSNEIIPMRMRDRYFLRDFKISPHFARSLATLRNLNNIHEVNVHRLRCTTH